MRCLYKTNGVRCTKHAALNERVCEAHYGVLEDCSICYEKLDLKKEHVALTPCQHMFHLDCVHKYYMFVLAKPPFQEFVCPMCKQPVDSKTKGMISCG